MASYAHVYILASTFKHLYIGVTTDLQFRVWQHKNPKDNLSFTARYNINRLVYFEGFGLVTRAIRREKELKGWLRIRKIELIVGSNPTWRDLSEDWDKPVRLLDPLA
jgi:putative endonuclease